MAAANGSTGSCAPCYADDFDLILLPQNFGTDFTCIAPIYFTEEEKRKVTQLNSGIVPYWIIELVSAAVQTLAISKHHPRYSKERRARIVGAIFAVIGIESFNPLIPQK